MQTQNILDMHSKSLREIQQYDPFAAPPDAQIAQRHRMANMIGEQIKQQSDEICPCCYKPIHKQQYDLRCSIQDIGFLGNAIELYFKSIKIAIVMLTVLALLFTAEWTVYHHLFCQQQCQNSQINVFSWRLSTDIEFELKFCLVGMIVLVLLPLLAKRYYDVEAYLLKKDKYQPQHFTLLLQGFPKCKEDDLKIWIFKEFGVYPLEIHTVYDIQEIKQVHAKKEKDLIAFNKQNIKLLNGFTLMSDSFDKELLDKKQNSVNNELKRLDSIIHQFMHSKTYKHSGTILAVFSNPLQAQEIVQKYHISPLQKMCKLLRGRKEKELKYCDRNISVNRAMNPRDCMWKSFHYNNLSIKIIASIVLALFGYFLLFITAYAHNLFFGKLLWPYSFFVTFFSYAIFHLLLHVSAQAYLSGCDWHSFTQRQKYSFYIYLYFNVFLVCMLPYTTDLSGHNLLQMINLLVFLDAFIHPVIKVFNFSNIYRKMLASYIVSLQKNKNPYPQSYLNKLMEGRKFKIGQNYHFLMRALLISCYYSHANPLTFAYYAISLVVQYWTQKYLLLRKCRTPPKFSEQLSDSFMELLGAIPVLYVLGVYQFTSAFYDNDGQYTWYFIIVLMAAKLLSFLMFLYFRARKAEWKPSKTYSQVQNQFTQYYQLENQINKYNGELKNVHKTFANRMVIGLHTPPRLVDTIEPLLDSQYKNSQIYSPQLKNTRARLVRRLLSTSIEMSRFAAFRDFQSSFQHPS